MKIRKLQKSIQKYTTRVCFLSHLESKTNLVTLRNCNLYLRYYKIDLGLSIKLQEINLNLCEEYKNLLICATYGC